MRPIKTACLGFALATYPVIACAGGVDHVRWCEMQTYAPSKGTGMNVKAPDGRPRGARSAAALVLEARKAARAGGRNDEAIAWAALCQWPNADAAYEIRRDQDAVLSYLRLKF